MSENFVRILRYPLIANKYAPLKKDLPDDISLEQSIKEAKEYGKEHNRLPSYLLHNQTCYKFMNDGVIEMGGENNKTCIRKVCNLF